MENVNNDYLEEVVADDSKVGKRMEDFLKETIRPLEVYPGVSKVNISADPGSRTIRTMDYSFGDDIESDLGVLEIDSSYGIADGVKMEDHMSDTKDVLGDNLEIYIRDITPTEDGTPLKDKVFTEIRLVKANLAVKTKLAGPGVSGVISKSNQEPTFVNILCSIGLTHLLMSKKQGRMESVIEPTLPIALVDSDVSKSLSKTKFIEKLAGVYEFALPRLNIKFTIRILRDKILLLSESEAGIRYWYSENPELAAKYKTVILVDCGGSTTDYRFVDNGIITQKAYSLPKAGGSLEDFISEKLTNTEMFDKISKKDAEAGIKDGYLTSGNREIPIIAAIDAAKKSTAKDLMNGFFELLTANDSSPTKVQAVLFGGRSFGETTYRTEKSVSMSKYIMDRYRKVSQHTHDFILEDEYAILKGLAYYHYSLLV